MVPADSPYLQRHLSEMLEFGGISQLDRVLEIGCGMGRYTLLLHSRKIQTEGMDVSQVLLDRLRAYHRGQFSVPLHCEDIHEPASELENLFDVALGFFVLHHLADLEQAFRGTRRLLKPGGRVVFLEPNPLNPLYYLQILGTPGMTWKGDGGIVRMRPSLVFRALSEAGFERCAVRRFGFFPPFLTNRSWGPQLERVLEGMKLWGAFLPFQLFRAERS